MKLSRRIVVVILSALMFTWLTACEKEGPAEKAGKAIDEAASNVADDASEMKESIEKKMDE